MMSARRTFPLLAPRVFASRRVFLAVWCLGFALPHAVVAADPAPAVAGESFRTETTGDTPPADSAHGAPDLPVAAIPPRPAGRVLDNARIFSPEEAAALAATLREASERDGLDVYVVATTFVLGETVEDYSHRLAEAWMESPRGFILLYLRGEQTLTMSTPDSEGAFLQPHLLRHAYEEAVREAAGAEAAPERIRISLDAMLGGVRQAVDDKARMGRTFNPEVLRALAYFLAALTLLGAVGWAVARLFARLNQHQDARFVFPPTPVPPRFGAPFGGGVCSEIQFANPPAG